MKQLHQKTTGKEKEKQRKMGGGGKARTIKEGEMAKEMKRRGGGGPNMAKNRRCFKELF